MSRADNSEHLRHAAQRRHEEARRRAEEALARLDGEGGQVNLQTFARAAGVSRSWLYGQADLRAQIEHRRALLPLSRSQAPPRAQRASDDSLRQRLQVALDDNRRLRAHNQELEQRVARLHGELRGAGRSRPD